MSSPEEKVTIVLQRNAQPFRVTLIRGQRGGYGWRIDVSAESRDRLLYEVDLIDTFLRGKYLDNQSKVQPVQKFSDTDFAEPFRRMEQALQNMKQAAEKPTALTGNRKQ